MANTCLQQALRVSITGPIGSGKTTLIHGLSKRLWPTYDLVVATIESAESRLWYALANPTETPDQSKDARFLQQQGILPQERIKSITEPTTIEELAKTAGLELALIEHGGNNLAKAFDTALTDATIYVLDVIGAREALNRGGTGVVHSGLLILNKTDLAPYLGISLSQLADEIRQQRKDRPFVQANLQSEEGLNEIVGWLESYLRLPVEQRNDRQNSPMLVEEQWFWRYKLSRETHSHFNTIERKKPLSAAPMSSAPFCYSEEGQVAWDQMWGDFCDLAVIGGPPHRGTLLEPISAADVGSNTAAYAQVVAEIERGIQLVTGLTTAHSPIPGWVGVECEDETMAVWLQQAILAENVSVRRDGNRLYLPAGPDFQLKEEIKNVITAIAKTHHYWQEHLRKQGNKEKKDPLCQAFLEVILKQERN
jgi:urease accessory protein UreG